jgi:hypothetical protein
VGRRCNGIPGLVGRLHHGRPAFNLTESSVRRSDTDPMRTSGLIGYTEPDYSIRAGPEFFAYIEKTKSVSPWHLNQTADAQIRPEEESRAV